MERIPGGTRENDVLETGIIGGLWGAAAARIAWPVRVCHAALSALVLAAFAAGHAPHLALGAAAGRPAGAA